MRNCCKSEVQVIDTNDTRFNESKSGTFEQPYNLPQIDMAMRVPEVSRKTHSPHLGLSKVNKEHPAARLYHPAQLGQKLSAGGSPEVMNHHGAKGQIEARVRKGEPLGGGVLELNIDARPRRFHSRPRQHFRRGIDAADSTSKASDFLRENRESAGSAGDIQYRLTGPETREIEQSLTQLSLAPSQGETYDRVVE